MNVYGLDKRPFFALAPMDDVTDTVFRQVVASCAPPDVFFTEFVNVDGLMSPGRPNLLKKLRFAEKEGKVIAQLWGLEPNNFEAVAQQIADGSLARELGLPPHVNFAGIDLNMGCPAKSEVRNGACAALIRRESWPLAEAIIRATQAGLDGRLPLSVKTRVGFTAVDMDWFDFLLRFDLAMLIVHGRTRKQMSKVPADWDLIGHVRKKRDALGVHTLIVGNGDVMSRSHGEALARQHQLDGIMIGRGIFTNPYIFAKPEHLEDGPLDWGKCDVATKINLYRQHVELFAKTWKNGERPIVTLNKFCKMYIQGFGGASALRTALMMAESTDQILELLSNHELSRASIAPKQITTYDRSKMSKQIKAIVFDSDGTLLDTRQLILRGYKTVLERHDLEHLATDHYIRQRLGKPVPETYEQIVAGHDIPLSIDELAAEHDSVQNELTHLIEPYPHTEQLLRAWKAMGIKLCLFTSGKRMMVDRNFRAAGISDVDDLFDAMVTADEQLARKPEPDAIVELLHRVSVAPEDAVVVGDHAYDIIAAKRARVGLKVGLLHGFGTSHELLTAGADFLADNLMSLNHLMTFAIDSDKETFQGSQND